MNVLYFNFFSIILYGFLLLNKYTKEKWGNFFFVLTTLQLIIFNGFRDTSIGVDTYRYARHFYRIRELTSIRELLDYDMEIGFVLFYRVIGILFNHQIAFLIAAIIIFTSLAFFIKNYSSNVLLSYYMFISLGFFESTFNTMRQWLAISITLIAFHFAMKKKPQHFFLFTLIAASFHSAAIIVIPILFLSYYKFNFKQLSILTVLYTLLLTFRYEIGRTFTLLYYGERAEAYLEIYSISPGIGGTVLALLLIFVLFTVMHAPTRDFDDSLLNVTYNINLVAIFIQTLSSFSYMFTRLNLFYIIYIIVYIPKLLEESKNTILTNYYPLLEIAKKVILVTIVVVLGYSYLMNVSNNINRLLPFEFGWEYYF